MTAAVTAALAKSAPIVRRRFGGPEIDALVTAREKLRTVQVRQQLGIAKGFHVQSLRQLLARHDALIQALHDSERARASADPLPLNFDFR